MSEKKKKNDDSSAIDATVQNVGGKFKDIHGEFKKIIWPDRKTLVKHTINVILISGLIGAVIVVMDLMFSQGYTQFIRIFT